MCAGPSQRFPSPVGRLRIEEVEADAALPQILHLRAATLGRRISLSPDIHAWSDPLDVHASHWCAFHDNTLAAAARLAVRTEAGGLLGAPQPGDACPLPVAQMSHCVVDPRFPVHDIEAMLDAIRIERARHLRCATLVAKPESLRRVSALAALGFNARDGILVLDLTRDDEPAIGRRPRRG